MIRKYLPLLVMSLLTGLTYSQDQNLSQLQFLLGDWKGKGSGFGNQTSTIQAQFKSAMDGAYIEAVHESNFAPTVEKPEGEHHIDKGFISFDKSRNKIVYRQFNSEGYINQYVLNDSLSDTSTLVFETEIIENFVPGGKARLTINKIGDNEIETVFDVSFPGKEYACFGTNVLVRQ